MKFTYESQGSNTYLVCDISDDSIDTMSLGMLTNNKIAGFAPAVYTRSDDTKYVMYNVSAQITMKQFLMGTVNRKRLLAFLTGIADALVTAEEYMIDVYTILLDEDHIFVNVSTGEPEVICVPVVSEHDSPIEYGSFFKNVIFRTQYDQSENCDYVAAIINYLNSTPRLLLEDFRQMLGRLQNGQEAAAPPVSRVMEPLPSAVSTQERKTGVQDTPVQEPVRPQVRQEPVLPAARPQVRQDSVLPPDKPRSEQRAAAAPQKAPDIPASQLSFAIPGGGTVKAKNEPKSAVGENKAEDGEKISMFYLLQHYNKENAAAYKAQKEAQKADKNAGKKAKEKKSAPSVPQNIVSGEAYPGGSQVSVPPRSVTLGAAQQGDMSGQASQETGRTALPAAKTPTYEGLPYDRLMKDAREQGVGSGNAGFGETMILGNASSGETMILNMGTQQETACPYLIRLKNNEKIPLDKPFFRVGRERDYVDYCVRDNAAVGRSHANFIIRNGECFVVDTNSTNHTFVDGQMIPSNQEIPLMHGARVRLANEEFEFRMQ